MSDIHKCETCGSEVRVGGERTTHFYIPLMKDLMAWLKLPRNQWKPAHAAFPKGETREIAVEIERQIRALEIERDDFRAERDEWKRVAADYDISSSTIRIEELQKELKLQDEANDLLMRNLEEANARLADGMILFSSVRQYYAAKAEGAVENWSPETACERLNLPFSLIPKTEDKRGMFLFWLRVDALVKFEQADALIAAEKGKPGEVR